MKLFKSICALFLIVNIVQSIRATSGGGFGPNSGGGVSTSRSTSSTGTWTALNAANTGPGYSYRRPSGNTGSRWFEGKNTYIGEHVRAGDKFK